MIMENIIQKKYNGNFKIYSDNLLEYKRAKNKYDFNDMI